MSVGVTTHKTSNDLFVNMRNIKAYRAPLTFCVIILFRKRKELLLNVDVLEGVHFYPAVLSVGNRY